ncbi:MAG TPA: cupin domain-containing protein [Candidatus Dormibacteraeota bacterium]|jgi:mannose-6-phosphate isomerase-like protein (cupin superfamily)
MEALRIELKDVAKENEYFRQVLFTGVHSQLVVMALKPGEEIGEEVHEVDQFIYAVSGEGEAAMAGVATPFAKGEALCVPAGSLHNVRNSGDEPMKLFTVYSPPEHAAGTVEKSKADVHEDAQAKVR